MEHTMHLNPGPFEKIREGTKTIELRLYDEKRKRVSAGDTIRFRNTQDADEELRASVVALHVFQDFETLYKALPLEQCGYRIEEVPQAKASDMNAYYPPEKQKKWGVVGIEIKLL